MANPQKLPTCCKVFFVLLSILFALFYHVYNDISKDLRLKQIGFVNDDQMRQFGKVQAANQTVKRDTIRNSTREYSINNSRRSPIQHQNTMYTISKVQPKQLYGLDLRLTHLQLIELKPQDPKQHCTHQPLNTVLLINTHTKRIGLSYLNLVKAIQDQLKEEFRESTSDQQPCSSFRILILKEQQSLVLEDGWVESYISEMQKALVSALELTKGKLKILVWEQGGALLMRSLISMIQAKHNAILKSVKQKVQKILFINLYNPQSFINSQPICYFLQDIKLKILSNRRVLEAFNCINMIMISTLKGQQQLLGQLRGERRKQGNNDKTIVQQPNQHQTKEYDLLHNHLFIFTPHNHYIINQSAVLSQILQNPTFNSIEFTDTLDLVHSDYMTLQNTTFLHTTEMAHLHLSLREEHYLNFGPFLQTLAKFVAMDLAQKRGLSLKAAGYWFRYGQAAKSDKLPPEVDFYGSSGEKPCIQYHINFNEPILLTVTDLCAILNATHTPNPEPSPQASKSSSQYGFILYSNDGPFNLYEWSSLSSIPAHSATNNRITFLLSQLLQPVIIHNPKKLAIRVLCGEVLSPKFPLLAIFQQHQILYMDQAPEQKLWPQMQEAKKFIVQTCSGQHRIFPDDFPIGLNERHYLLEMSEADCYTQKQLAHSFLSPILSNRLFYLNLVIFSLLIIGFKPQDSVKFTLAKLCLFFSIIFCSTPEITLSSLIAALVVAYFVNYLLTETASMAQMIHVQRKKVFLAMLLIFLVALLCQTFGFSQYNYWKTLSIFVVFFINQRNVLLVVVKFYFLWPQMLSSPYDWVQILMLMAFLYCTHGDKPYSYSWQRLPMVQNTKTLLSIVVLINYAIVLTTNPNSTHFVTPLIDSFVKIEILVKILYQVLKQ